MATRFEQLPNEVLFQIFEYLKVADLHGFFNQNQRMNDVIHGMNLNIVVEENVCEDQNWNYLKILFPEQFIRLELRSIWNAFDLNTFQQLRSLSLTSHYLLDDQIDQLLTVRLPYLERFSIDKVEYEENDYAKQLFQALIDNEHFPSLKVCRFSGQDLNLLFDKSDCQIPNTTIRSLALNQCFGSLFNRILTFLPNLHRLETDIREPQFDPVDLHLKHHSLEYLRITIKDPLLDLQTILPHVPRLKRLRITGKIAEDTVLKYFEALSHLLQSVESNLRVFHCELYFHARDPQISIDLIQQLNPLFRAIQCRLGRGINQCYTTDLEEYPHFSEYSHVEKRKLNWFPTSPRNRYPSDRYRYTNGRRISGCLMGYAGYYEKKPWF